MATHLASEYNAPLFDGLVRAAILFHKLGRGHLDLASLQVPLNSVPRVRGEVENVPANQRPGGHFAFPIGPKNINLVEDVEMLLAVFCFHCWRTKESMMAHVAKFYGRLWLIHSVLRA